MRSGINFAALALAMAIGLTSSAQDAKQDQGKSKLDEVVKIEFPKDGYTFTLVEAAKKIKIEYKIIIERDCEGVIPLPFGPSFTELAGPSGLHPREQISGKDQLYCLLDSGLAQPPREVVKKLKKGTYVHSFEWDGRNRIQSGLAGRNRRGR